MQNENNRQLTGLLCCCPFNAADTNCRLHQYRNGADPGHLTAVTNRLDETHKKELLDHHHCCFTRRAGELVYRRKFGNSNGYDFAYRKKTLTKRELEIIPLITMGMTENEIAQKLHIKEETVRTHRKNIYLKLEVNKRELLIWRAIALGIG